MAQRWIGYNVFCWAKAQPTVEQRQKNVVLAIGGNIMPTVLAAIQKLVPFSDQPEVADILDKLSAIDKETDIELLRNAIKKILLLDKKDQAMKEGNSLSDGAYDTLLALAEFKPLNEKDPISLETIDESSKIYTSSGHQYDINSLINYHQTRLLRYSLKEHANKKILLDPSTNLPFSERDGQHIQAVANQKGLTVYIGLRTNALSGPRFFQTNAALQGLIDEDFITSEEVHALSWMKIYALQLTSSLIICGYITIETVKQFTRENLTRVESLLDDPEVLSLVEQKIVTIAQIIAFSKDDYLCFCCVPQLIRNQFLTIPEGSSLMFEEWFQLKKPRIIDFILHGGLTIPQIRHLSPEQINDLILNNIESILQNSTNDAMPSEAHSSCACSIS